MENELYNSLNNISNDEFKNILNEKTPVESYLNIMIQKRVKQYNEKIMKIIIRLKQLILKRKKFLLNILH